MRLASAAALLACLSSCASASSIATGEAQAGQQPREDRAAAVGSSLPPGLGFLRALGGECRSCLKECLGTQATALQQASLRWQAPISLVTWYLFRNRPFKMWPLEEVVYNALKVHPAVWGSLAAGGYMSCSSQCDAECPFPGQRYDPSGPAMRELEEIDAADTSWLMRLYRQGGSRGGGSRGGIQDTLGTLFQL